MEAGYDVAVRTNVWSECLVQRGTERWLGRGADDDQALDDAIAQLLPSHLGRALLLQHLVDAVGRSKPHPASFFHGLEVLLITPAPPAPPGAPQARLRSPPRCPRRWLRRRPRPSRPLRRPRWSAPAEPVVEAPAAAVARPPPVAPVVVAPPPVAPVVVAPPPVAPVVVAPPPVAPVVVAPPPVAPVIAGPRRPWLRCRPADLEPIVTPRREIEPERPRLRAVDALNSVEKLLTGIEGSAGEPGADVRQIAGGFNVLVWICRARSIEEALPACARWSTRWRGWRAG